MQGRTQWCTTFKVLKGEKSIKIQKEKLKKIQKDTLTPVFIAALFTITRSWK